MTDIELTTQLNEKLLLSELNNTDKVMVLCDTNTHQHCFPLLLQHVPRLTDAIVEVVEPGEETKTLVTAERLWQSMQQHQLTRRSLLLNLGGGVVTDLGGFVAATYRRGIHFINLPTTLLAMVDASVGGKTGLNFLGVKNQIGVFATPNKIIINTQFLATLSEAEYYSGLAEMVKHALLTDVDMLKQTLACQPTDTSTPAFLQLLQRNIETKQHYVTNDLYDYGIRQALNLGHTFGHAFEAQAMTMQRPIAHGNAVAWGLLCALYLSVQKHNFPKEWLTILFQFTRDNYAQLPFDCSHYDHLLALMYADKKRVGENVVMTLLSNIGQPQVQQTVTRNEILATLDFLREY
ncbi:MAG: 3-dehydroquinate synthase [Bacteroidales bacterium]|nr:3-dehydroquinate synthase [Bacteroidales bacterium]